VAQCKESQPTDFGQPCHWHAVTYQQQVIGKYISKTTWKVLGGKVCWFNAIATRNNKQSSPHSTCTQEVTGSNLARDIWHLVGRRGFFHSLLTKVGTVTRLRLESGNECGPRVAGGGSCSLGQSPALLSLHYQTKLSGPRSWGWMASPPLPQPQTHPQTLSASSHSTLTPDHEGEKTNTLST
jgi:hypothetical protein